MAALALVLGVSLSGCSSATPTATPVPPSASAPATTAAATAVPSASSGGGGGGGGVASPTPDPGLATAAEDALVESALAALPDDRARVGQLLMLGWSGTTAASAASTIRSLKPGAIVFVQNARRAADARTITAGLRQLAADAVALPMLIAIDHEGGAIQRIDDVPNLGSNREFAATSPTPMDACERGRDHADQLHAMGFSMDLAPVLDVDTNPKNPVIGDRSYSSDPTIVATLGAAYIRGLQDGGGGIAAVGKHFPGHGDTSVDSHRALPVLDFALDRLDKVELVPFVAAVAGDTNVAAIMVGHIALPKIDKSGRPATMSRPIVNGLLRQRLGFDGLVITDDLSAMQAITDRYSPATAAVAAINAGVDMLILGSVPVRQRQARDAILAALKSGKITRGRLNDALRHVLRVKARYGVLAGREGEPLPPSDCG